LENLCDCAYINGGWETIRENIKISGNESLRYYELKQHKPMKDVRNYLIKGNKPNCNSYTIWDKLMGIIRIMQDVKLEYISGTKRTNIWKTILMSLEHTVTIRTSETY
jgi:hypothetical protein